MKSTGTPEQFADKLEISRSTLLEHLKEFKLMGAEIEYNRHIQSYTYKDDQSLQVSFGHTQLSEEALLKVRGGSNKTFEQNQSPVILDFVDLKLLRRHFRSAHLVSVG
ncbi:hypothetical protein [Reichenbachiella faecimaris]|nr:hypothetical protein [Reichenbachiella faecimaris]